MSFGEIVRVKKEVIRDFQKNNTPLTSPLKRGIKFTHPCIPLKMDASTVLFTSFDVLSFFGKIISRIRQ